jgi:5-methylcytosine-specific restriction protein B
MTFADRNALFLRTALEALRDADGPMARQQVFAEVAGRLTFTPDELETDDRGHIRWRVQLGFRTSEAVAVGWMTKRNGSWAITEAGMQALQDFPGTDLLTELRRRYQPQTKRAWLVRGSSVDGRDLVPVWLRKGSMSLAASGLRPVTPPVPRAELKAFVNEDYHHKPYSAREAKLAEFDAFCNRMRAGDLVLTTTQGKAYLGRITGDAEYVVSSDQRSNLRRAVAWLNDTRPVPFAKLPDPLPAKLHNQSDVVDLTENIATIELLWRELEGPGTSTPAPARELAFRPVPGELAGKLLIDRAWLQRQADLLWNRRQLIFYGPPGTGKTFLARELAQHLAEPSAVKLVQFHPSYTYEDFFEGFRPVQRDDGQLAFELRPGPFRALVDDARLHLTDPYILIIDEINRANLAKVFGELYFLLEYRDDSISLLYSTEASFTLPKNVFVIGTMNTTDRSIALVDAAMRRRFAFVELHPSQPPTSGVLRAWLRRLTEAGGVEHHADAADLLDALNLAIDDRDLQIGPSYLMHPDIYRRPDGLAEVWETSILPLLEEHHYGSPREILDRYRLATLRKFPQQHPRRTVMTSEDDVSTGSATNHGEAGC